MKRIVVLLLALLLCCGSFACAESQRAQDAFVASVEGALIGKTFQDVEAVFGPFSMVYFEEDKPAAYVFTKTNIVFHFDAPQAQAGWMAQLPGGTGFIPGAIALRDIRSTDVCIGVSGRIRDFGIAESDVNAMANYMKSLRLTSEETKANTVYTLTTGDGAYDVFVYCAHGETTVTADHQIRVMTAGLSSALTPSAAEESSGLTELRNASVGDYVSFGSYPQSRTGATKEPIEWLVLDRSGSRLLLISRYALDNVPYNSKRVDTAWSECTLRKWLNHTFLNNAFTAEEQRYIATAKVKADSNPSSAFGDSWQGEDKAGKVFLLSAREAKRYFKSNADRTCQATDYAKYAGTNKAYTDSQTGNCWWWLRTIGLDSDYATNVWVTGEIDFSGNLVSHGYGAIRPAIWVDPGA